MKIYKVVYVKDEYVDIFNAYHDILPILYHDQQSTYHSKQIDLIFEVMDNKKYFLDDYFSLRNDYVYHHNLYSVENIVTGKFIHIKINKYDIEVYEEDNSTIIYDYLKVFKKNFYMFSL